MSKAGFTNVETREADRESLPLEAGTCDAAVCRLGLMLFPEPARGLSEMRRVLKPDGGVCTAVFSCPEANPCIRVLMATALKHAGLPPGTHISREGCLAWASPVSSEQASGARASGTLRPPSSMRRLRCRPLGITSSLGSVGHPDSANPEQAGRHGRCYRLGRDGGAPARLRDQRRLAGAERTASDRGPTITGGACRTRRKPTPPKCDLGDHFRARTTRAVLTPNVGDDRRPAVSEAAKPRNAAGRPCRCGWCTPDMGMSLWGESPLWEDPM